MQTFRETINNLLEAVFHNILRVEEEYLQKGLGPGLTIREMHIIEYVGKGGKEGRTLSEIASFFKVARPSITVAAKKLEEREYLTKNTSLQDKRVVRVTLTREGRKVYLSHMRFHTLLANELEEDLNEDEKQTLINTMIKMDKYFEKS
ncbi:MAG: MarR family transcriptional regulator [Oscillospiraceae bacterium]|nr:MarR family transcriptional regulator [Oscillospiraceae bacterium]